MIVLDAYAVLALLKDEPAADEVQRLIKGGEAALTVLGVAEVLHHLIRLGGASEDTAALDLAQLGLASPPALEAGTAMQAGFLRARHYHRTDRAISLADCVAAETARERDSALATADPHLLDTCTDEGIAVITLPDSAGSIWSPRG